MRPLLIACAASILLSACGQSGGPGNGSSTGVLPDPAGTPGDGGGNPTTALTPATIEPQLNLLPDGRPGDIYAMASGCFGVQHQQTGRFLRADGDGSYTFDAERADATGFTMKAAGLGRYVFYASDETWLSIAGDNEAEVEESARAARVAAASASGGGDLIEIFEPAGGVSDGINDGAGQAGDAGADGAGVTAVNRRLRFTDVAFNGSEWAVDGAPGAFSVNNALTSASLGTAAALDDGDAATFDFIPGGAQTTCAPYPEAQLNASGVPTRGTNPDGTVFGYAETHMHLGGSEALGGQIGYGRPFHKFGIPHALGNCSANHGEGGNADGLDAIVNRDQDTPMHDTQGWPTYVDWPSSGGQTHHQTYWLWLKRAWLGGLRFMVNHLVANELLCQQWPQKENDCDEMESARLQLELVEELQDYIDAQAGGPGKGFFRIVGSPAEARAVIESGRMAVINGTENEKVFSCGEFLDMAECTEAEIVERVAEWYDMGLRAVFPIHIFDNAFGGSEIARFTSDAALIQVYNAGNNAETGHSYATIPCSEAEATEIEESENEDRDIFGLILTQVQNPPPFPGGCVNNARSLTSLGDFFINHLIDTGIFIETDHTGPLARKRMLSIAMERGVPVVSGHTGSITPRRDSSGIIATGGVISNLTDDPVDVTIEFIHSLEAAHFEVFGSTETLATGFGSDINGIHRQSSPRDDAAENPLAYPFTGYRSNITFDRQVSGERTFDLNTDGVAHYGLYPDYLADMETAEGGQKALRYIFRSAEAYLRMWEQIDRVRDQAAAAP